jgi:YHS domain-containing protein
MTRLTTSVAALALVIGLAGSAWAAPAGAPGAPPAGAMPAPKKMAKTPSCPVCHMALSTKKTKTNTKAVKIHGKTYYCCAKCPMKKT